LLLFGLIENHKPGQEWTMAELKVYDVIIYIACFGYKTGGYAKIKTKQKKPVHFNYLIDTRCLGPPPFLIEAMKARNGTDEVLQKFLEPNLSKLAEHEAEHLANLIGNWWRKLRQVNIGIGSSFGLHRSVAMQVILTKKLSVLLEEEYGWKIKIIGTYFGSFKSDYKLLHDSFASSVQA